VEGGGTPIQSVEVEAPQVRAANSIVSDDQWSAMQHILNTVYAFRKPEYVVPIQCLPR